MRRRILATMAGLISTGLVALMASPAAAAEVCQGDAEFPLCVTSIVYQPASVSNTTDTTVTVTVTATPGFKRLQAEVNNQIVDQETKLAELTEGTSGQYRGTFRVLKSAQPGSFQFDRIYPPGLAGSNWDISGSTLDAAGLPRLTVTGTGTRDSIAPVAKSLSLSSTAVQDVTTKAAALTVTARLADSGSGVWTADVTAVAVNNDSYVATLKQSSGTKSDGIWTGTLTLPAGIGRAHTLTVHATDHFGNRRTVSTTQIAGAPTGITTKVTKLPPAPSFLTVVTLPSLRPDVPGPFVQANWGNSWPGQPVAVQWQISWSGACGTGSRVETSTQVQLLTGGSGVCTVKVRPGNSLGYSTSTSSGSAVVL